MKILRRLLLIVFALTAAVFIYYSYHISGGADRTPPEISAQGEGPLYLPVAASQEDYLQGLKAVDNKDGDVTDSIVMVSRSAFVSKGKLKANFAAFDQSNNVGTFSREVIYTDYVSPQFSMSEPLNRSYSDDDDLHGVTVSDMLDGDITGNIREISTDYSSDNKGFLPVTLQVTNSGGDTSSLNVKVHKSTSDAYAQICPWLTDYVFYVNAGDPQPDYQAAVQGTWVNGKGTKFLDNGERQTQINGTIYDVTFNTGTVDYRTPGQYTAQCTLVDTHESSDSYGSSDQEDETLGTADIYIIVQEKANGAE